MKRLLLLVAIASFSPGSSAQDAPPADTPGKAPQEALKAMALPKGFSARLVAAEPDVHQPIAMTIDDRGRLWVLENKEYPHCPGEPKNNILIFEDQDGDGGFDKRTVFFDKVPFASGLQVGFGGVWIGAPPNLLFFPDRNSDDRPDSAAENVLDGWGSEDTHETLNNFTWGLDGWLYGTQGIFTNSKVGAPGTPLEQRTPLNAGVWRYHPTKKRFEIFSEGASNQWGIDWNDHGQAFFTACVIPHMWHAVQGGRYHRQAGSHFNKFTYDDIKTITDHDHEKRAYCGAMVYLGGLFPAQYRNTIFFNNIHSNKMQNDRLERDGSGFVARNAGDFLVSNDRWFRALSPQYGPDGSVFVNDWYDKVPCHQQRADTDRTNGRLYKITYEGVKPVNVDLARSSDGELVQMQLHQNEWYVRHARRILQERGANTEVHRELQGMLKDHPDEARKLRALWALHATSGLTESIALEQLDSPMEYIRAWTIQLLAEDRDPSVAALDKFAALAKSDKSPVVRLYLASALQRTPLERRWPVLDGLLTHGEDANDRNLPMMIWYALEPAIPGHEEQAAAALATCQIPRLQEFIARRLGSLAAR